MIWAYEHRAAFDRANLEAHFHFNHCLESGMWLCDDCFEAQGEGKTMCRNVKRNISPCFGIF